MQTKNLVKEPPRSPRIRLGGYVILGRTIDKCRALLAGTLGEFHFDCPLDNVLFAFKGIKGDAFKAEVSKGRTDDQLVSWLNSVGLPKSAEEIARWSDEVEAASLYAIPAKREYFSVECAKLGLDPAVTSTFDWLEADDRASFKR